MIAKFVLVGILLTSALWITTLNFHQNMFTEARWPCYSAIVRHFPTKFGYRWRISVVYIISIFHRDNFVYAHSQWETTLQCNVVSHWLGVFTKWPLSPSYWKCPGKFWGNKLWQYRHKSYTANVWSCSESKQSIYPGRPIMHVVEFCCAWYFWDWPFKTKYDVFVAST